MSLYGLQSHQLSKEIARKTYSPLAERSLQFDKLNKYSILMLY